MMKHARLGFTLIELLVVITVIAILASLLIPMINSVRFTAKKMVTGQRMNMVTQGLSQRGQEEGSASYALQGELGLPGVIRFDPTASTPTPALGSFVTETPNPGAYPPNPDVDNFFFNYPWGKMRPNPDPDPQLGQNPTQHLLRNISSAQTIPLLRAAGILISESFTDGNGNGVWDSGESYTDSNGNGAYDDYRSLYKTDRSEKQPWNDRWGHPLVVAYAMFQAGPTGTVCRQTLALQTYQYARSLYVAVAAAGTFVRNITPQKLASSSDTDWTASVSWDNSSYGSVSGGNLALIWKQVNQICQQNGLDWDEKSFDNPPWHDVKHGKKPVNGHDENCFLSAPLEIK